MSNPTRFIKPEFWPDSVEFKEPSKYSAPETNKILLFWCTKQKKNEIPFRFERVPIGNSVEPECYPDEIFNIMSLPPAPPPPIKPKVKHTVAMRDYGNSDDSEKYNSKLDDEEEFDYPPGLSEDSELEDNRGSDVAPLTLPDSDQASESSTRDGFSDLRTNVKKQKKGTKVAKGVPKEKIVVTDTAAVTKKKKAKIPAAPQRVTRASHAEDTLPTRGTRSETTGKQKGKK